LSASHTLAIDLGTGSCRAIVFGADGTPRGMGQREWSHATLPGAPGSQVFDTAGNWRLICACIGEAIERSGLAATDLAAVTSSSMREGMVLYDKAGHEIWACPNVDSRAASQADELVRAGHARRIFELGGDWVSITSPARFLWIREHEPETFAAMAHVGMLSDWVLTKLTGRFVTDPSCGSSSNLFDLRSRAWSATSLELIGVPPEVMPDVLEPGTVMGEITPAAAGQTGLAQGTPVVVGGADTQLGLLGIGVASPGTLTLVGGSFWQLTLVTDQPVIDPQARLRTLCHVLPGMWMTEGIGFYSGKVLRWVRDALCEPERAEAARRGLDPYEVMEAAAAEIPAGANGLLAILSNVMDVKRWVQAPPSFVGFDVEDPARTDRRAIIRAVQEQAAFATRGHLAILEELSGRSFDAVGFTGGGANGQLWARIVADVLGVTVRVPVVKESTALGAALFAGLGAGFYDDVAAAALEVARIERTVEPDPASQRTYDEAYGRWSQVYPRMLQLAEERLAAPMWWPAGADAMSDPRSPTT
jgi:autoinducer 2 (AI-2) kinase